jgi:hypothetical protein
MPVAIVVVRKHPANDPLALYLEVAGVFLQGAGERLIAAR